MSNPSSLPLANPSRSTPLHLILLAMILILATALRLYHLNTTSFWFDEVASVVLACGHWELLFHPLNGYFPHAPDIASPTALMPLYTLLFEGDSHPPLYVLLLRGWWALFGMSQGSCRAMSVVASLLTIAVVYDITRLIARPTVALWACLLMAVAPTQIRYAQEARDYAPLLLFGAGACDAMLRLHLLGPSRKRYAALALSTAAALMTHYFVAGAVVGVAIFALLRSSPDVRLKSMLIVGVCFALLFATRLPLVLKHRGKTSAAVHYLDESREGLIGRALGRSATIPMLHIIAPRDDGLALGAPSVLLLIFPFFLDRRRPGLMLMALWGVGTIGLVALSDVILGHNALLYPRYTLAAAPGVIVSLVVMADLCGKWLRHAVPLLAVIGATLGIPETYQTEWWTKTESRQWAADIKSRVQPDDVLVVSSDPDKGLSSAGFEYPELAYYARPNCAVAILEGSATPATRKAIWAHHRVWIAECFLSDLPTACLGPFHVVESGKVYYSAGRVVRVERDEPPAPTALSASRHST